MEALVKGVAFAMGTERAGREMCGLTGVVARRATVDEGGSDTIEGGRLQN